MATLKIFINISVLKVENSVNKKFLNSIPGQPVVPSTPSSLAPFITKINEPWTSELETPDAKLIAKAKISSAERINCLQIVSFPLFKD